MWTPDAFLEQIYERTPDYSFKSGTYAEWADWRPALVNALKRAIVLPAAEAVNPDPVVLGREDYGAYVREHLLLRTAPHLTMPCYLLIPKNAVPPYPAVIACPGHGYGYKQLIGLLPDGSDRAGEPGSYKDYPVELVKRGMLVIVPELLGLGDRRLEQDQAKDPKENSCFRLATNLLMAGKTLAGYRV
ncbi:alpha/beta hydrolase family protein, partial [Paenibacillus sepulcri]|nr:alpha/beta hydrolase family protein [Paenibacillus sepulcri]